LNIEQVHLEYLYLQPNCMAWSWAFSWLAFSYKIYRALTLGNLRFETSVATSQQTTGVYYVNHIQHIDTLHSCLMLKQAVCTVTAMLW